MRAVGPERLNPKMHRKAAVFASTFALLSSPAWAGSVSHGFSVRVKPPGASVAIEAHPKSAAATDEGRSLSVRDALVIRPGLAHGLRIRFEIVDPAVSSVDVLGLGKPLHVEHDAAAVVAGPDDSATRRLSYVVHYGDSSRTPRRSVPLRVTLLP